LKYLIIEYDTFKRQISPIVEMTAPLKGHFEEGTTEKSLRRNWKHKKEK